ncbi:unnamed protein product [Merluccius merluccius]
MAQMNASIWGLYSTGVTPGAGWCLSGCVCLVRASRLPLTRFPVEKTNPVCGDWNRDEGKRCHRYCSHSGGPGVLKAERNRSRKSEEEEGDNGAHFREQQQQQHLETKAIL